MSATNLEIEAEYGKVRAWSRKFWRELDGQRVGITEDESVSEGLAALVEAARTYDRGRGVPFGPYVKQAVWHAVKRHILRQRVHHKKAGVELTERIEAPDRLSARSQEALDFLRSKGGKAERLMSEIESGRWQMTRESRALMDETRARFGEQKPARRDRSRNLSSREAAQFLRLPERRLRALSEQERIAARRDGAVWQYKRKDLTRYRRRKILSALDKGVRYRGAAAQLRCSDFTVRHHAKRAGYERRRGRPAMTPETATYQRMLIWSMLTDPIAHALAWEGERPMIRRIARAAGCLQRTVQREAVGS